MSNISELDVIRCEKIHNTIQDLRIVAILQDPDGNPIPGTPGIKLNYREGISMPSVITIAGKSGTPETYVRLKSMEDSTEVYTPFELGLESIVKTDTPPQE
jgi:hypothetical protein